MEWNFFFSAQFTVNCNASMRMRKIKMRQRMRWNIVLDEAFFMATMAASVLIVKRAARINGVWTKKRAKINSHLE